MGILIRGVDKMSQDEPLEILASRRDIEDKVSIQIHEYFFVKGIEYVKVSYGGEVRNLLVHSEIYPKGKSPYNQEIKKLPYIVIKNNVYPIDTFVTVGYRDDVEEVYGL